MDENAFERHFRSEKTPINIEEAAEFSSRIQNELIRAGNAWDNKDVKSAFEKHYRSREFSLQGMTRIAKGDELVVAITHEQWDALEAIFNINATDAIGRNIQVIVKGVTSNIEESARLKWVHVRSPMNQIIISKGLERSLKLQKDEEIQLVDLVEDFSDLDLDKY